MIPRQSNRSYSPSRKYWSRNWIIIPRKQLYKYKYLFLCKNICGTIFGSTERELLESWLASWGRITSRSRCCGRGSALLLHFFKFRVFNCMHLQMLFHCAGIASFYVDLWTTMLAFWLSRRYLVKKIPQIAAPFSSHDESQLKRCITTIDLERFRPFFGHHKCPSLIVALVVIVVLVVVVD